jgi:hypothetical protein
LSQVGPIQQPDSDDGKKKERRRKNVGPERRVHVDEQKYLITEPKEKEIREIPDHTLQGSNHTEGHNGRDTPHNDSSHTRRQLL